MKLKRLLILMLSLVLVLAFAGTAFAQEDDTPEEEVCGDPIASLFEAYYSVDAGEGGASGFVDEITEASITVDGVTYLINEETVMEGAVVAGAVVTVEYITDESENLVATRVAVGAEEAEETTSICDEVTAYHEEGMGWGVLTKLYAIAAESLEACDGEADCGVTVDELVEMFNSGTGMGQLFNEYGKPAQLGVGHLRKAVCDNGNGNGNGQANANGQGKDKSENGKENGNNGNGKGGDDDGDGDGDDTSQSQGKGKGGGKGKGKGGGGGGKANANANANAGGGDGTSGTADSDDDEGEPDEDEGEEAEDEGETDENEDEADTESDSSCGEEEEAGDEGDDEGEVDEEEEEDED